MPLGIYEGLRLERPRDGVVLVALDRPDTLNALTFAMFDSITSLCADVAGDVSVRAVVLTGTGTGFCAGLDFDAAAELHAMPPLTFLRNQETWAGASLALHNLPIPVIAAVNGAAAGAGFSLALACDLRVASTKARFLASFIRIGLTGGDMGSSWLLPRLVGVGAANDLLLTGRPVEAEEALRIGLVNRVVPPDELVAAALAYADAIVANSPVGVGLTKQVLAANLGAATLEIAVEMENRNQALAAQSDDMPEALNAFLGKRAPVFSGG